MPNFEKLVENETRNALEQHLLEEPDALVYLEKARKYLGWSHTTALKRFRRLRLPIYPEPEDRRVKKVRLEDVLWIEEVFLASTKGQWSDPFWWDDVKRFRNTEKDIAFSAPLPRSVGGYDERHPNNLLLDVYEKQKRLREQRQERYSTYKRRKPLDS
jgi:hypothetical protein